MHQFGMDVKPQGIARVRRARRRGSPMESDTKERLDSHRGGMG